MELHCRNTTAFTPDGRLDEDAMRALFQRFVDANIGVYMCSSPLEGFTLSVEEIARVYELGVEVCKGKVFVGANGPERHTALDTIEICRLGVEAGVDHVNIYGPPAWHVARPNDAEYFQYFARIFEVIDYPVALAPNTAIGYSPSAGVVAQLCNEFPQVVTVNFAGQSDDIFFINLKDALAREVETYVTVAGSLNLFAMGATGLTAVEANFIPRTFRRYMDCWERGDLAEAGAIYADIKRFVQLVGERNPNWGHRWVKMAMAAFKLPGWAGGMREPHLLPDDAEVQRFATGALALHIPEIDEMGSAAGLI
ncbi:MAG TPA: dihydrodipicolinate synthase family protein [Acidimicrobiales bacterium]